MLVDSSSALLWARAFCTATAWAAEAPFLWLLLGTAGASEFLEGRDRELLLLLLLLLAVGLSGKLPTAGVEGLLALPLLVVVTGCIVKGVATAGVGSFRTSTSSAGLAELSFLWPPADCGVGALSLCCLTGSLFAIALGGSICVFVVSLLGAREPLFCVGISIGVGTVPFGLFAAAEGGRCRLLSALEASEP